MNRHDYCPKNCPFAWSDLDPHLIHASLGPSKSKTQTASQLVRPFSTAHRTASLYFTMGHRLKIAPCNRWGPDTPSYEVSGPHWIHDALGPSEPITQMAYLVQLTAECPHTLQWLLLPLQNCPFPWEDLDPIWYTVPSAHPSPQPNGISIGWTSFCRAHYYDRPTVRRRYSVGNNRPRLCM